MQNKQNLNKLALPNWIFWRINLYIFCTKHDKLQIPSVFLHYKILKLYNQASIIFLNIILPTNVFEQHLRVLLHSLYQTTFCSPDFCWKQISVSWISVYLMLQIHLFNASKVQFLERRRIKTKVSRQEQKQGLVNKMMVLRHFSHLRVILFWA